MSRTLNDDFDEDDLPGGSLDLDKGSNQGHAGAGAASSYDSSGMDFDDDFGDAPQGAHGLELDLPSRGPASGPVSRAPQAPQAPSKHPGGPHGGPVVPDLAFDEAPQTPRSQPSRGAPPAPPSSHPSHPSHPRSHAPQGPASSNPHAFAEQHGDPASEPSLAPHPPSSPELQGPPPPPAKPTAASVIAKYPPPPAKIWQAPKYAMQVLMRQFELRNDLESLRRRRSPDVPLYEAALRAYDAKTFRLGMAISIAIFMVASFIFFLPVILRFIRAD